jgi:hypothetical protein
MAVKVLSNDELKNCTGTYAIAYAELPNRKNNSSKNVHDLNQNGCNKISKFDEALNSPMTPPPNYDAVSRTPNYQEVMQARKLLSR